LLALSRETQKIAGGKIHKEIHNWRIKMKNPVIVDAICTVIKSKRVEFSED
jgi:hypothetical protein